MRTLVAKLIWLMKSFTTSPNGSRMRTAPCCSRSAAPATSSGMPSVCLVRSAAICASSLPSAITSIPSGPQPCWRDTSCTIQSVSPPTVDTLIFWPLRSATVRIVESPRTTSTSPSGGPAKAATPSSVLPLATKASSGPEPRPISMALAASPCCSLALPAKSVLSIARPWRPKKPLAMPTSSGVKSNGPAIALPTRSVSSPRAPPLPSASIAASAKAAKPRGRCGCVITPPFELAQV